MAKPLHTKHIKISTSKAKRSQIEDAQSRKFEKRLITDHMRDELALARSLREPVS